jgi:hypothetical protein
MSVKCPLNKDFPDSYPLCCFGSSVRERTPIIHLKINWLCTYPQLGKINLDELKDNYQQGQIGDDSKNK